MAAGKGKSAARSRLRSRRDSEKRATVRKDKAHGFYDSALSEAERILLPQAKEMEGLEEEIALLRVKLNSVIAQEPENMALVLKGISMLTRAVATKYRLSKEAKGNLADAIDSVLKEIGGALYPEAFSESED